MSLEVRRPCLSFSCLLPLLTFTIGVINYKIKKEFIFIWNISRWN
jgi:hypothetical protein